MASKKITKKAATKSGSLVVKKPASKPKPKAKAIAKRDVRSSSAGGSRTGDGVESFLVGLDHSLKKELEAVRRTILGVRTPTGSPPIIEGIKWNSLSFRTMDWFATVNVHGKDSLRIILHTGAKVKTSKTKGLKIADPTGILKWLARDRAMVTLKGGKESEFKGAMKVLGAIVREWIGHL